MFGKIMYITAVPKFLHWEIYPSVFLSILAALTTPSRLLSDSLNWGFMLCLRYLRTITISAIDLQLAYETVSLRYIHLRVLD